MRNFLYRSCTADSAWLLSGRVTGSPDSADRSAARYVSITRARAFRRHHRRRVAQHAFEEVQRLRRHLPGIDVVDPFARHGRHRILRAVLHGVEPVGALGVVEEQRAFGAGDLDRGGAVVRIARRQVPAAADRHQHAIVHGHGAPHDVIGAVDVFHVAIGALRIDAHRLCRLEQPEDEIEIVRRLHRRRRQPAAAGDLLAEAARQMPAHHHRHRFAQRAVADLLLGVSEAGIETLRIADGEFEIAAPRDLDQLIGLEQFERDRLFQQHMLAGFQAIPRDRIVIGFRRGRDVDHRDAVVLDDVLIIQRRGRRVGQRLHFGEAVGPDLADVQLVHQRGTRQRFRAYAAAPAGSDHRDFDLLHAWVPFLSL